MGRPAGTGARSHSSSGTQQEEEGGERGSERRNERERASGSELRITSSGKREHEEAYQCGFFKRGEGLRLPRGGRALLFRFI